LDGYTHGQGTRTYWDGEKFVGELHFGNHGKGFYYDKDGKLIGLFENGEQVWALLYRGSRNGEIGWYEEEWEGVESSVNKDYGKYEGGIKDGKRDGIGTYTWSDGSKYAGSWLEGKMWNGTEYDRDGNITGKVVNNQFIKQ